MNFKLSLNIIFFKKKEIVYQGNENLDKYYDEDSASLISSVKLVY